MRMRVGVGMMGVMRWRRRGGSRIRIFEGEMDGCCLGGGGGTRVVVCWGGSWIWWFSASS
jgi:hypothetical protein